MMADGSMRMLDPQTNAWVTVIYVREGTGMDYITQNLVPPFPLDHGQIVTMNSKSRSTPSRTWTSPTVKPLSA